MKFKIKTRELELTKALDEAFLRLCLMALRVCQVVFSIPIIGFAAAFTSALSNEDQNVPSKLSAALAIASVCTLYTGLTFLPVIFEGPLFFTIVAIFDALFVAAWSSLIGSEFGTTTEQGPAMLLSTSTSTHVHESHTSRRTAVWSRRCLPSWSSICECRCPSARLCLSQITNGTTEPHSFHPRL
jgi:hypothetical protein